MSQLRAVLCLVTTLALPVALCGCPVAIVGGLAAAGGTGYAANQERGVTGTFDDMTIKTNIQNAWLQVNPLMQRDFTITVYEGRTLLTGMTPSPELKASSAGREPDPGGSRDLQRDRGGPGRRRLGECQGHLDIVADPLEPRVCRPGSLGQLHGRYGERIGLSDRFGPHPGGARPRNRSRAERPQCEAGRLVRRNSAGRTGHRPAGSAAATGTRADARCAFCRRTGGRCRGAETLI